MTKKTKIKAQKKAEEDANLDEALAETFPASDPPSMTQPRTGADAATDAFRMGLDELRALARDNYCAIMCAEAVC
jgi:hypothetical protein